MKKFFLLILFGWVAFMLKAQPPNNPIFFGGNGDGANASAYSIPTNFIFAGGTGDGFGNRSNNLLSNTIFTGGFGDGTSFTANSVLFNNIFTGSTGDGFAVQSNSAVANSIFLGSTGDGFSNQTNNAVSNLIFLGSSGDGFVNSGNASLPNSIFAGGEGDGWHAVVLPLGPLPVTLLSFTAEQAATAHLVKWITTAEINTSHYEVQRSANARDFVTAGTVAPTGANNVGASYNFTVVKPWPGNNFYRLKMVDKDGTIAYSNTVLVKNIGDMQIQVFPNPTADWLYVSIPNFANSKPIIASLLDANGRLISKPLLKPGSNNAIQVGYLNAGVYTLQCIINNQPFVCRFIKYN